MELVAAQTPKRLLFKQGDMGVVVEVQPDGSAVKYPPFNLQSILARGYWEDPAHVKAPTGHRAAALLAGAREA